MAARLSSAAAAPPKPAPPAAPPLRARLAMIGLAAVALLPALSLSWQFAQSEWPRVEDPIGDFDRRLAPLRERLRGEAKVGYLPPGGSLAASDAAAHFYLTRYALAPVVVVNQTDQRLIVADGADPRRLPPSLVVVHDLGGGLLLLRPASP